MFHALGRCAARPNIVVVFIINFWAMSRMSFGRGFCNAFLSTTATQRAAFRRLGPPSPASSFAPLFPASRAEAVLVLPRKRGITTSTTTQRCQSSSERSDKEVSRMIQRRNSSPPIDVTTGLSSLALSIEESMQQVLQQVPHLGVLVDDDHHSNNPLHVPPTTPKRRLVITLSVSGGCDSVALLHACMEWWSLRSRQHHPRSDDPLPAEAAFPFTDDDDNTIAISIQVVHFNHQQRGVESDQDMALVQDLCEKYQIPCRIELWQDYYQDRSSSSSLSSLSSSSSSFSQDAARQWRRRRLRELCKEKVMADEQESSEGGVDGVGIIMTAHHKDDSIESLVLKALRGVHLLNLSGMASISQLDDNDDDIGDGDDDNNSSDHQRPFIFLVRPWVQDISKQDLVDYMEERQLEWREDESNTSPKYLRNRVRNELIPLLQDLTDGAFVESRVPIWIQQSQELAADLQPRVEAHLLKCTTTTTTTAASTTGSAEMVCLFDWEQSCRLLAEQSSSSSSSSSPSCTTTRSSSDYISATHLVQSQALYQWMATTRERRSASSPYSPRRRPMMAVVSHKAFQRVLDQLRLHPDRKDWIVELGQGWSVKRRGPVLQVLVPAPEH